jgi:hypothetical protein
VLLRLLLRESRTCLDCPCDSHIEVIHTYVEVHRRVLFTGLARPDGALVLSIGLDVDRWTGLASGGQS